MANITINITFDFTVSFDVKESEYSFILTRKDTDLTIAIRNLPCKNSYTRTTSNLHINQVKHHTKICGQFMRTQSYLLLFYELHLCVDTN